MSKCDGEGWGIGTSGYDYPEWKGIFYPKTLPRKDFLSYYASCFNALELNNTFYGMPTKERIESYVERSENRLHFSIKAPKIFTHEIKSSWKSSAVEFAKAAAPMSEKNLLSSVLFQFPASFSYSNDSRIFLSELLKAFGNFPCAVEFRNSQWHRTSVFDGLSERSVSVAFSDMPEISRLHDGMEQAWKRSDAYFRLHSRREDAWYSDSAEARHFYSENELKKFLPEIELLQKGGRKCQIYFNNAADGSGIMNALQLKDLAKNL